MHQQYRALKPFHLEFFRPVSIGETVSLDPDHLEKYGISDCVELISENAIVSPEIPINEAPIEPKPLDVENLPAIEHPP